MSLELKMDRRTLIDKIIQDKRKYVLRDFIKRGIGNQLVVYEYSRYADENEMISILSERKTCLDFIQTMKLTERWFKFVFDKYCREQFDSDIVSALVENQADCFSIREYDYLDNNATIYRERLLSSGVIRDLNGNLLRELNDRRLVPDGVIYDVNDKVARAVACNKVFTNIVKLDTMQVIMFLRKLTEEEIEHYLSILREQSEFVYAGGLGILFSTQKVSDELMLDTLNRFSNIKLPDSNNGVEKTERWVRGLLKNQNLDNIIDKVLEKINYNEFLINLMLEHNTETSTKVLLKVLKDSKSKLDSYKATGYPVLTGSII